MELLSYQVAVCQIKGEWRHVCLVNGKQFVITTGVRMKQEWCVDNSDIPLKVCNIQSCIAHKEYTFVSYRCSASNTGSIWNGNRYDSRTDKMQWYRKTIGRLCYQRCT